MNLCVLGAQWGDEGKGKIVDLLAPNFDIVARYQGGHNAGHTIVVDGQKYVFRLIPSGILHPDVICVLGNGMVISPRAFLEEIDQIKKLGVAVNERIRISDRAHLITPWCQFLDEAREDAGKKSGRQIGTTRRGIGTTYERKMARDGIRAVDILSDKVMIQAVHANLQVFETLLPKKYHKGLNAAADEFMHAAAGLRPYVHDTGHLLRQAKLDGKDVMFESAQGTMLDIDHGTYPYVTSSNCTAGGVATGLGIPPNSVGTVLGITKAYLTRVGEGPMPTELFGDSCERIRKAGNEFGAVTGRPRRPGWLDLFQLEYACEVNGITALAMTKGDVLDGFGPVQVCTHYLYRGESLRSFPADARELADCKPVYRVLAGWDHTAGVREWNGLDPAFKAYVKFIEDYTGVPVVLISSGQDRSDTIVQNDALAKGFMWLDGVLEKA